MLVLTLALIGLGLAVRSLWRRTTELSKQQASLSAGYAELRRRQETLEREWLSLQQRQPDATPPPPVPVADLLPPAPARPAPPTPQPTPHPDPMPATPPASSAERPFPPPTPSSSEPPVFAKASRWLIAFFTTGNVVAKAGIVIVFFGVAFLLRYAAERGMLPIEYRLMATAGGALVLLGVGWRLRHARREYAVVLQGGAVGLLYLTIFAAFRLYGLLPATLTFSLLLMVVGFSGVLAVVQNAMSLAVLGTSGGFLAPILASTGTGSHIALFSYYAVLNTGVAGIAWFRAWRFLNWLAFVFTFGIGFLWGQEYYQPSLFTTTEPFLVLFFLIFLLVSVLFAHRQPPQLRGYIDGSLVFGTPAVAFGMQSVLVEEIPFGRAYSAVVLSALYLALTRMLWRRDPELRPLAEAFLALAVVFLILAVPLAFDGHATAAAWALEGAALVWIGTRQNRRLARLAGAALLLGAGVAFGVMTTPSVSALAVLNTRFLGGVAIAVGSVIAGRQLSRTARGLGSPEGLLEWVLLVWGLLWWLGSVEAEILDHVATRLLAASTLLAMAASACLIALLARRWDWRAMMHATMPIGPLMWIWVLPLFLLGDVEGPLTDGGWLAWPAVLASSYLLAFMFERVWPLLVIRIWHVGAAWLLMFLTTWTLAAAVHRLVPETRTWSATIWCLAPAMFVLGLPALRRWLPWPMQRFASLYALAIPTAPVVAMLCWVIWACGQAGSAAPLPYVPLLNPLELTQAIALIVSYAWWARASGSAIGAAIGTVGRVLSDPAMHGFAYPALLAGLAFLALNVVVGRVVHFFLQVPFDMDVLLGSSIFQTGISILWGVTAGALMTVARRRLNRPVWIAGAGLLAVLIIKLFLIDLGNAGGIARIVSFLATGVLILLIGYFAPAPPKSAPPATESVS